MAQAVSRFRTRDVAHPRRTLHSEITILGVALDDKDGIVSGHILHLHLGLVGVEILDWNVKSEGNIPRDDAVIPTRRFETDFGSEQKLGQRFEAIYTQAARYLIQYR